MSSDERSSSPSVPAVPAVEEADSAAAEERRADAARRAVDRRVRAVVEGMSDAFLALDPEWRVTYANHEAARLNGTTPEALVGRVHWEVWPETVGTDLERHYRDVAHRREPVRFLQHYPGDDLWHDVRAYPADDGGIAVFYRDVTADRRMELERERVARDLTLAHDRAMASETQFRLLVDRVRDYAIFLIDPDGIVTHWGQGAERMKGWTSAEIVGKHLSVLYPPGGAAEDGSAEEHLEHTRRHGEYAGEGTRMRRNGELFHARVVLTALRREGRLVGFSKITQDLSDERSREDALREAMRRAEAASVAKSQFLANTSHEIRTPLNAVIGYAELLELGIAGALEARQITFVQRIQATSRHLLALVNDVLDLSKIEAGRMQPSSEPGLVHDAVAAAVALVEPQAQARQVRLVNACTGSARAYRGDPERVRQILVNLLSNAIRFTAADGRVTATCGHADAPPASAVVGGDGGPWTFIRVQDTGIGIDPRELDSIWEAFVQADNSRTRQHGGSGLGLTISRHLARLMGGDILVTSQLGLGSSFVLWLPSATLAETGDSRRDIDSVVPMLMTTVRPGAFDELSKRLLGDTERIVARYVSRLCRDPGTPSAHALRPNEAEDHSVTFIADLVQCIAVIGADGPLTGDLVRDGTDIQTLIARRHGVQRAQLGFGEAEVRRDFAILREEMEAAIRQHADAVGVEDAELALRLIVPFFDVAVRESVAAWHDAARAAARATGAKGATAAAPTGG